MARIVLLDKHGWELPDFYSIGPDTIDDPENAKHIVADLVLHHISPNKLAGVSCIRVEDSTGIIADYHEEDWKLW